MFITSWRVVLAAAVAGFASARVTVAWQCIDRGWQSADLEPIPRFASGLVADPSRNVLFTFGGMYSWAGGPYENATTWEWRSAAGDWVKRNSIVSPSARDSHSLAYDPVRRKIVLFGGFELGSPNTVRADTWEFDTQTGQWNQCFPAVSPPARQGAAMVFDEPSGVILMVGGEDAYGTVMNTELWVWDGGNWTTRPQTVAPTTLSFSPLVSESTRGHYLCLGPSGVSLTATTWRFDSIGNTWTQLNPAHQPPARWTHALIPDSDRRRIVLYGGKSVTGSLLGDTWEWDEASADWIERLPRSTPGTRRYAGGALDPESRKPVIYGGLRFTSATGNTTFGDLWDWDGAAGEWMRRFERTFPHYGPGSFAMAYDALRQRVVLWPGGSAGSSAMWEWDGARWASINAPLLGTGKMSLAYDGARVIAVVPVGVMLQTWAWDGASWERRSNCAASFTELPMLAYDEQRHRVVLFSGSTRQTWEWDGASWQFRFTGGPPARITSMMAYDSWRGITVVHGGRDALGLFTIGDTWEWDGQAWTNPTSGPVVYGAPMAFDAVRGEVVLHYTSGSSYRWNGAGGWVRIVGRQEVVTVGLLAFHEAAQHMVNWGIIPVGPTLELSGAATLTRACAPCYSNCDGSIPAPALNIDDFQCFLNRFATSDPYANCDHSTAAPTLTAADFQCFLNQFVAGCV